MSDELKTINELAAEAFPDDEDREIEVAFNRQRGAAIARKQAEQCRPYMQHRVDCGSRQSFGRYRINCDCGLDARLEAMK